MSTNEKSVNHSAAIATIFDCWKVVENDFYKMENSSYFNVMFYCMDKFVNTRKVLV